MLLKAIKFNVSVDKKIQFELSWTALDVQKAGFHVIISCI